MQIVNKMDWNQKPHRYTVDFPEPLVPLIEARKNSVPYPSVSKYIFWTVVYELFLRKPHRLTPWIMQQPEPKQQEIFEDLIKNFDTMKSPGSWMETRIKEKAIDLIKSGEVDNLVIQRARQLNALLEDR